MVTQQQIKSARQHHYDLAEGFCDDGLSMLLPPEVAAKLNAAAQELSSASGIPFDEAISALCNEAIRHILNL